LQVLLASESGKFHDHLNQEDDCEEQICNVTQLNEPEWWVVMLTGQEKGVNQDEHDNQLLKLLALADFFTLNGNVNEPLGLFIAGTAALFLVLLALAGRSPATILAWWLSLVSLIFELLLLLLIVLLLLFDLKLDLLLELDLVLDLLLPIVFLIESRIQVTGLYSNHKVEDDEGTKDDTTDEEEIEHVGSFSISHDVHHVGPSLKGDDLENVHDGQKDVVEAIGAGDWISVHIACHHILLFLAETRDVSVIAVFNLSTDVLLLVNTKIDDHWISWLLWNVAGNAPPLEMASEELGGDGTEHDQHEEEQHHDIEHDGQRVQNG
jgi:hypothetical protein